MLPVMSRVGGWIVADERSAFAIDWKMAIVGGLVLMGLAGTTVVAALEGLPWVTKEEMHQREEVWQGKLDSIASIQATNASQLTANNSQLTTLTVQFATMATKQAEDEKELDSLERQKINSLERNLKQKQLADQLNRKHYDKEMKTMERAVASHAVPL